MTVYVVPCGISVLGAWDRRNSPSRPVGAKIGKIIEALDRWATDTPLTSTDRDRIADADVITSALTMCDAAAKDAKLPEWPAEICAETSTLSQRGVRRLTGHDRRVILLASDTREGISAAFCVAYMIAAGDGQRIRYVSAPTSDLEANAFRGMIHPGAVTITRLPGLPGDLDQAVGAIGHVLRAAHLLNEDMEVHLTGGFKITLLHTLAMTEIVYSMAPERTSAWYTFQDHDAGATRINLRCYAEDFHDLMRDELLRVKNGLEPRKGSDPFHAGVAWVKEGSGWRLNDFGRGYLAVLGQDGVPGSNDGGR
ncbi:hypothetical protein AB0K12_15305 [Nonomuraea sp. NPDC049419]|uniref:hypothetical protein n=1 Tax=Nonomuraea sp. NPDC049419 TaxID=3155772 RepID=UPI00342179BC